MLDNNKNLKNYSQMLRKDMPKAETRLWTRLRGKQLNQIQFYRQKIIGNYIVDFYCPQASLVIELDGVQHYTEEGRYKDKQCDNYLQSQGLYILRYSDRDWKTHHTPQSDRLLEKGSISKNSRSMIS